MKFQSIVCTAAALVAPITAAPLTARAISDADILNYALTLEHLEDTFYRQGLQKFSKEHFAAAGYDETFYKNIKQVSYDETTHVSFLTTALTKAKAKPVAECTYDFGYKDVKGFLTVASILEGVGVSAYLGAAASIMEKNYLTAAGSILTVESRHSSYIRAGLKLVPFAQPFDAPLTFNEVYTLAAQFIKKCPDTNVKLPVKAFPSLALDAKYMHAKTGDKVVLTSKAKVGGYGKTYYAAFIAVTGPTFVPAKVVHGGFEVTIPDGFYGQSYAVITSDNKAVTDDNTVAGPAVIEIAVPSKY